MTKPTHINRLKTTQNGAHRTATGCTINTNINHLHDETKMQLLHVFVVDGPRDLQGRTGSNTATTGLAPPGHFLPSPLPLLPALPFLFPLHSFSPHRHLAFFSGPSARQPETCHLFCHKLPPLPLFFSSSLPLSLVATLLLCTGIRAQPWP